MNVPQRLRQAGIAPFVLRAGQLENAKPVIAYWCHYWALNRVLAEKLHAEDAECAEFCTNIMDKLEQAKVTLAGNDAITDDMAGQAYVEAFAQETFDRAMRPLDAGKVTQQTASAFEAAATFFQLVNIWQTPDSETAEKIKFAKWNAARILRAIKAGQDPNESNPKPKQQEELPEAEAPALDPNDPEVQMLASSQPRPATVEDAPPEDGHAGKSLQPPPGPVSAPTSPPAPSAPSPDQVSPIAPPDLPAPDSASYFPPPAVPASPPSPPAAVPDESSFFNLPSAPPDQPTGFPRNPLDSFAHDDTPVIPSPSAHNPIAPPAAAPHVASPPPIQPPQDTYTPPVTRSAPVVPVPQSQSPAAAPPPQQFYKPPTQQQYGTNVDDADIADAQKHAKWAISALNFEDVPTAVKELQAALARLGAR